MEPTVSEQIDKVKDILREAYKKSVDPEVKELLKKAAQLL